MSAVTIKIVRIGLFLGLIIFVLSSQELLESFQDGEGIFSDGQDMGQDIAIDPEGNVYVTGYGFREESSFDFVTLKYDAEGNLIWEKRYNGPANSSDYAQAIEVGPEGSVYVVGHSNGIDTSLDATIVKYDKHGHLLWMRRYDGPAQKDDWAYDVARSPDGGIVIAGYSFGQRTEHDYLVLKYSADGEHLWTARHNPPRNRDDVCQGLAIDAKGNVYVTGIDRTQETAYDMATLKYDARGRLNWLARHAGPAQAFDAAKDIAVDPDGNVFVTGYSFAGETEYDVVTIKYDAEGQERWAKSYDGPSHLIDCGLELAVSRDGGVFVAGLSIDPDSGADCLLIHYDAEGNQVWLSRFSGSGNGGDVPQSVALDSESNVIVAGYSRGQETGRDCYVIKYEIQGSQLWLQRYDGGSNDEDAVTAMTVDPEGCIHVTGYCHSRETGYDFVTLKYSPEGQLLWTALYPGRQSEDSCGK